MHISKKYQKENNRNYVFLVIFIWRCVEINKILLKMSIKLCYYVCAILKTNR